MRTLSRTEKADEYDRILERVHARQPSIELIMNRRVKPHENELYLLLAAFDILIDEYKHGILDATGGVHPSQEAPTV